MNIVNNTWSGWADMHVVLPILTKMGICRNISVVFVFQSQITEQFLQTTLQSLYGARQADRCGGVHSRNFEAKVSKRKKKNVK
jgi:hypothetical protein